jgi:hypothetical protein
MRLPIHKATHSQPFSGLTAVRTVAAFSGVTLLVRAEGPRAQSLAHLHLREPLHFISAHVSRAGVVRLVVKFTDRDFFILASGVLSNCCQEEAHPYLPACYQTRCLTIALISKQLFPCVPNGYLYCELYAVPDSRQGMGFCRGQVWQLQTASHRASNSDE